MLNIRGNSVPAEHMNTSNGLAQFLAKVYGWMAIGLALTGGTGWLVYANPALFHLITGNSIIFYGVLILQFVEVMLFVSLIDAVGAAGAVCLFLCYAVTVGLTFSVIFAEFQLSSIFGIFATTAGMFAGLAVWGTLTKQNLGGCGGTLFMALLGVIIGSVVNLFLHSGPLDYLLSWAGVIIFSGLTAYDAQKVANIYVQGESSDQETKGAIHGALSLYLDFINLFLDLIRLFGKRNN